MLGISWIFVSAILLADSTVTALNHSDDEYKTAEVALQSVLGLNNTDQADAIKLLDKVEKVIGNIKSVFEGKNIVRPANDDAKLEKFTDFVQNLIKRLKKYDDKDLVYFVTIFNDEIRKYNYKGCKFHELLENFNLRRFLSNMLTDLQNQSGAVIKNSLEAIANKIKHDNFNKNEKNLVDLMNSVYRQDSLEKFQTFLAQINNYKQNSDKIDLVTTIKEGLRSIIFDYYSQLNSNARNTLKHEVNNFWNNLSQHESFELDDSSKSQRTKNIRNKIKEKNKLTAKYILDKSDLRKAIMKSEVKKQSLYLFNSINAPKSDKIRSFRNDEYVNLNQTTQLHDEFIQVKDQHLKEKSVFPTVSPIIFTTRLLKIRRKMLTFKTLYPDLVPEWTSITQLPLRRFMSYRPPVRHHNAEKRKLFRKRGRVKGRRLVKIINASAKINDVDSRIPRMKKNHTKFRNRMLLKKIDLRSRKPIKQSTTFKTKQKYRMRPFRTNMGLRTSKLRRHGFRGHSSLTQIAYNYRKSNIQDYMNSEEGLSIDIPEEHDNKFRRSDTNFTHPDPDLQQFRSSLAPANNEIFDTTVIIGDINNDPPNDKGKFIRPKEENNVFNIHDLNKVQNIFEIKPRVEDENSTGTKINAVVDGNTQPNNNWEAHEILNEEKHKNEKTDHFYVKNNQDEIPKFNFRAKDSGNETESVINDQNKNNSKGIELEGKDDTKQVVNEEMPMYDEISINKHKEVKNIKTDNDFRTFIEDYDNDLKEFTRYKVTMRNKILTAETRTQSSLHSTTTSVTEDLIAKPAVETAEPTTLEPLKIISTNEKQDLVDTTTIKSFFDANLIKHLMKTNRHTTKATSPSLAVGRYFNRDGVVMDSMEKLKEEVAEATNFNYVEQ